MAACSKPGRELGDLSPGVTWVAGTQPDLALGRQVTEHLGEARRERCSHPLPARMTWVQRSIIRLVRGYQRRLSARVARTCIYEPSCSDYAVLTVAYNGVCIGAYDALRRWVRCRPSLTGGVDYPRGCGL
jgi:putative membrane protein insertion efficiency factor